MTNPFSKLRNWLTGRTNGMRAFIAAQVNRLTGDWNAGTFNIIQDIRTGGRALRTRARDLAQNNDIARRYINLVRTNVVGNTGFTLQLKAKLMSGEMDEVINTEIEEKFRDWSKRKHCSVNGNMSFRGIQDLLMTYVPRDGEVLVKLITNPRSKYGLQLQIIPPEYLDENLNKELADGGYVRMGIEYNAAGTVVRYWLRKPSTMTHVYGVFDISNYEPVPAKDIIHLYMPDFANQGRGYSWMAQSMLHMRMLHGYEDATLVNARVTAAKAMYWYTENGDTAPQGFTGDTKDAAGNNIQSIEPGMVDVGPPGYKPFQLAPEFPSQQHEMFVRTTLRAIASGLNVSYNMLANDLVGVNYSSIRAGLLDEREMWKVIQQWFTESFLEIVFERWLETAIFRRAVSVEMQDFERINQPYFHGRTWAWVDPMRDVEAKILEVAAGFETSTNIIAEKGKDITENYRTLAKEKKLAADLGLELKVNETDAPGKEKQPDDDDDGAPKGDDDDKLDEKKRAARIKQWTTIRDAADKVLTTINETHTSKD